MPTISRLSSTAAMSASQTATVTAAASATAASASPAAYTLFLSPSTSQAQHPAKTDHAKDAAQEEHLPMQFNAAKPAFTDKYAERQYVKERLALAYRVIASICHR